MDQVQVKTPDIAPVQTGPRVWYGPGVVKRESEWIFNLTPPELEELLAAANELTRASPNDDSLSLKPLDNFDPASVPLISAKVKNFSKILHDGMGFFVWRGVPVDIWTRKQCAAAFLIVGKCFGNLRQQNAKGHVLGHVKDLGLASSDPNARVYQTSERQTFHADSSDVVGLLCLKTAKSGGLSALVSVGAIYNEMLATHPELAKELFYTLPTDRRGEVAEGDLPYYNIPVLSWYEGYLSVMYQRQYINSSQRFPEAPRLTQAQVAALDLFDSLADSPKLNFTMQLLPGDMQFVHNHSLLHDRTGFEDWPEPEKKRHLLRMWIATPEARPLPAVFAERFGSVKIGYRGGIGVSGLESVAPLDA